MILLMGPTRSMISKAVLDFLVCVRCLEFRIIEQVIPLSAYSPVLFLFPLSSCVFPQMHR